MILLLILYITFIEAQLVCDPAYPYERIYQQGDGYWAIRCCSTPFDAPLPSISCSSGGSFRGGSCAVIFPSITSPTVCDCGTLCNGQLDSSGANTVCGSGPCTCTGVCCSAGAPCNSTPTAAPTKAPTKAPTSAPTKAPTKAPTNTPTNAPTKVPTSAPTNAPSLAPTVAPTQVPVGTPTAEPSAAPTETPTTTPTEAPSIIPTLTPTSEPSEAPTEAGNTGVGLAMGLIFGPLGAMFVVGAIFVSYQFYNPSVSGGKYSVA